MKTFFKIPRPGKIIDYLRSTTAVNAGDRIERKRGITLIEGVLYLVLASGMVVLVTQIIFDQQLRQENLIASADLGIVLDGAQRYVASEYDILLEDLLVEATASGSALLEVPMSNLSDAGLLPPTYFNNTGGTSPQNIFGQDYALLIRAVNRSDTTNPQATMTSLDIDSDGDGVIDAELTDNDPSNGEMDIEAILVTTGGENVPPQRGNPIITASENASSGYVQIADLARGPYANWALDISNFSSLPSYPTVGRFASIVALSRYGSLDGSGSGSADTEEFFSRCEGILDTLTTSSPEYQACLADANNVYSSIIFNSYDSNGDGVNDIFPTIEGLATIDMFVDADGDGIADVVSTINNINQINCGSGPATATLGELTIDCATTRLTGDLVVEGTTLTLDGNTITSSTSIGGTTESGIDVDTNLEADRFISEALGGQDLSEGVYDVRILASGQTIEKPTCPTDTFDGVTLQPRVYLAPAAYTEPNGIPVVGVRAFAQDNGADWTVRLFQFIAEDRHLNNLSSPPGNLCPQWGGTGACTVDSDSDGTPDGDGLADVYEVTPAFGRVLAMTRCF